MKKLTLFEYIRKSLSLGYSEDKIKIQLIAQGWPESQINEAFEQLSLKREKNASELIAPKPTTETSFHLSNLTAANILLYLGGLIVIIAGIIYISLNWSDWGAGGKILAIFLPMLLCYLVGSRLYFTPEHKQQSQVFIIVASLILPLFFGVLFTELDLFAKTFNEAYNLTLAIICFAVYLGLSFVFRFSIWSFLYLTAGLVVYYLIWINLGVPDFIDERNMAWLLLTPAGAYLLLTLFYDRIKQEVSARHSYYLGSFVLIISFYRLFKAGFLHVHISWFLMLFALGYFAFGAWLEKNQYKKYCSMPYLIAAGLIFFPLIQLAGQGTLLKNFLEISKQDLIGWSFVLVGLLFFMIAWLLSKLKKFQLEQAVNLSKFFEIMSPFFIMGAVFSLGLDGEKIFYEILLLILSLFFIFLSVVKSFTPFLYQGTIFLIIFLFSIGSEYFQNEVGWPLTLFSAGLLSMMIGVGIEKIKRKYIISKKQKSLN